MKFCDDYSQHFVARGRNSVQHARRYISGLLGRQRRKNMETICLGVREADYQGIEQFISSSSWDEKALLKQLAKDADRELGGEGSGLYIADNRLAALYSMAAEVNNSRGRLDPEIVANFKKAGYSEKQLLAITLAVSVKVLSNYSNHYFDTIVDDVFAAHKVA